jgi:Leucine-rich repeat (LRR) protein
LDISYSSGLLVADVVILSLFALTTGLFTFWLWRRSQFRFRYSLRGLLFATVLVAIPLGWLARQIYDWRREQFWIRELADVNIPIGPNQYTDLGQCRLSKSLFNVSVESSDFPEWLRRVWPESDWPIFHRVGILELRSWVTLRKRAYEPMLEAALHEMEHVRSLQVESGCEFRIRDPSAFANIEALECNDPIDDQTLKFIATIPHLRCLHLNAAKISDNALLGCLANCRWLEELSIASIKSAGVVQIAKCSGLQRLRIYSELSDASIAPLARLKRLQYLRLFSSQLTDAAIDTLDELPALEELKIDCPNFTDAGAKRLCELPRLRNLSLNDRLISAAASRQLKERIPILELR